MSRPAPACEEEPAQKVARNADEAPLAAFDVHVSARLGASSEEDRRLAEYRIEQLRCGEDIQTVTSEPGPQGTILVRAGPFTLRRASPGQSSVPPSFLWCFACLACELDEEPEVTEDEAEDAVAFLRGLRERVEADAEADAKRRILSDAEAAIADMIEESVVPLADAWKAVHSSDAAVLSPAECRCVVDAAESHAAAHGWSTRRHVAYPTTDLPVPSVKEVADWLPKAIAERLLPEFERRFGLGDDAEEPRRLHVEDLFIAKYESRAGGAQPGLATHEDGSPWSFVLALNDVQEYTGGGTQFVDLEDAPTHRAALGKAVMFSGKNRHRGVEVTSGVRYILAGFLGVSSKS